MLKQKANNEKRISSMEDKTRQEMVTYLRTLRETGKISSTETGKFVNIVLDLPSDNSTTKEIHQRPLMTKKEVAQRLNVSISTIERLCRKGLLKYQRIGSKEIRFMLKDVVDFLRRGKSSSIDIVD